MVSGGKEPASHQRLIIEKLQAVAEKKILRLALFLPPGSAKSTYASVLFPPWFLATGSGKNILACSHSTEKAEEFGRKCRNLIVEKQSTLGFELEASSKAAGRWEVTNKSNYFATGVGTGIAGYRADLAVIDDPIGKKEDAESELIRNKQWEWYLNDLKPRLKPHAAIVLIQTRWHEDDLAGRILENESADWEVISLPLIAEENDMLGRKSGEPLWTEWFTPKMIEDAKKYPRTFASLYQQRPTPDDGDFFKKEMLVEYASWDDLPADLIKYAGSDHAVSTKESADRTCLLPIGVDSRGDIWVLPDVVWDILPSDQVVTEMLAICKRHHPITWWAGREHITQAIGPFLRVRQREENIYVPLEEVVSVKDKRSRATSIRDRMAMGRVRFPAFASWWPKAKEELLKFTGFDDKHDDFVDALAEIGRGLDRLVSATTPRKEEPLALDRPLTWGMVKRQHKMQLQLDKARLIEN